MAGKNEIKLKIKLDSKEAIEGYRKFTQSAAAHLKKIQVAQAKLGNKKIDQKGTGIIKNIVGGLQKKITGDGGGGGKYGGAFRDAMKGSAKKIGERQRNTRKRSGGSGTSMQRAIEGEFNLDNIFKHIVPNKSFEEQFDLAEEALGVYEERFRKTPPLQETFPAFDYFDELIDDLGNPSMDWGKRSRSSKNRSCPPEKKF